MLNIQWHKLKRRVQKGSRQRHGQRPPLCTEMLEPRLCLSAGGMGDVALLDQYLPHEPLLAQAASQNMHVIAYNSQLDAPATILHRVAQYSAQTGQLIENLAIFSHGSAGRFQFGNQTLSADNIDLSPWIQFQATLAPQARIAIYGCDTAQGTAGQALLNTLAQATGATVWGSTNLTGAGGDWRLEARSQETGAGSTSTNSATLEPASFASYPGQLALPAAPSNLSVLVVNPNLANIFWTDNSDNETGFIVERATDSGFTQNLTAINSARSVISQPVNLSFDTIGNTGLGWTLPNNILNPWDSGYNATPGGDGGPNNGYDIYMNADLFLTASNPLGVTATNASGDLLQAGTYTITFAAGTAYSDTPVDLRITAYDDSTNTNLGSADVNALVALDSNGDPAADHDNWGTYQLTFTIPEGSAAIGQHLKLGFSSDAGGGYLVITDIAATKASETTDTITCQDPGFDTGISYFYRVRAFNADGESANSPTAQPVAVPTAPGNLSALLQSTTQIELTWTDNSSDETGFILERATDSGFTANFTVVTTTAVNLTSFSDTGLDPNTTYYYRLRATNAAGDSANTSPANATTPEVNKLTGTSIGTAGSWDGFSTIDKAFDGDFSTFVDVEDNAGWVGLDLGSASTITTLKFAPRATWANRMNGGRFEVSNQADFASATTIYTISSDPTEGVLTSVDVSVSGTWRYVRYVSPSGGYGNISELEIWGVAPLTLPSQPVGLTATAGGTTQIDLEWTDNSNNETGFIIERATSSDFAQNLTQLNTTAANTTSYSDTTGSPNTTYYYRVRSTNSLGDSSNTTSAHALLWNNTDIGPVGFAGSVSYSGGVYTITGSGSDIWDPPDGFNFTYQPMHGDGSIVARVTGMKNTSSWAKVGLMIRENISGSDSAISKYVDAVLTQGNGAAMQYRATTGAESSHVGLGWGNGAFWLRLNRIGDEFTSFGSWDGVDWTQIGSSVTISMAPDVYVGLVVTAQNNNALNTATIDQVSLPRFSTAPSSVTATAVSTAEIDLTWTDNSNDETGFLIERATNSDFTQNLTAIDAAANVTSYADTGLSQNQIYYYRVRANNFAGPGVASNIASDTTAAQAPGLSPNLTLTTFSNRFLLTWDTPADGPFDGFNVYRATSLNGTYTLLNPSGVINANTYTDSNVSVGTAYYYKVASVNPAGEGPPSTAVSATIALSQATFISKDSTTLGSWKGTYGSQGYLITGDETLLPAWANVSITYSGGMEGPETTTNPGDLQKAQSSTEHIFAPLWSFDTISVNLNFTDGLTHQVALYLQTGHPNGLSEMIQVVDTTTGNLLDVQEHRSWDLTRGTYVVFNVAGNVRIDLLFQGYPVNISGVFIDPAAQPTTTTFYDPLNDLSRTDSQRSSAGWDFNTQNGWQFATDASRIQPADSSTQSLVWHISGATSFSSNVFFSTDFFENFTDECQFYTSSDGLHWTLTSLTETTSALDNSGWLTSVLSHDSLPAGTNFVRLDITTWANWALSVGDVSIGHQIATAPTILTPATASTSDAYGTTINLGVTADDEAGEPSLIYTWSAGDNAPGSVTFTNNGANAGQNTTATFSQPGTYTLRVTVTNPNGRISFSTVVVNYHVTPLAPSGLLASVLSNSAIDLAWTDNSWDESGFIIERATNAGFTQGLTSWSTAADATTYHDIGLSAGTTYYYRIKGTNLAGNSAISSTASRATYALIPAPWTLNDVGNPTLTGTGWYNPANGTYYFNGAGDIEGIWDYTHGSYSYISQSFNGNNAVFVARLTHMDYTGEFAQAGLMIRDDSNGANDPAAQYVGLFISPDGYVRFQANNGQWIGTPGNEPANGAQWLKLVRTDDTFTGWISADGTHWSQVGVSATLTFSSQLSIGLAVTARNEGQLCTTSFDQVTFTLMPNGPDQLAATVLSHQQINLTWHDNAHNETGYTLERATNADFTSGLFTVHLSANTTSYADTSLTPDTAYYYRVRAYNTDGDSANSASLTARTQLQPVAPTVSPTLHLHSASGHLVISWDAPAGGPYTGYNLYRATTLNGTYTQLNTHGTLPGTTYTDSTTVRGVTYYYKVAVTNAVGEGPRSAALLGTLVIADATHVTTDSTTLGNWKGTYGSQGYMIFGDATNLPTWANLSLSGTYGDSGATTTTNAGDLQRAGSTTAHVFNAYWSFSTLSVNFDFTDGQSHQVAFYVQPGNANGASNIFRVFDADSGALLNVQEFSTRDTTRGSYIVLNLAGKVRVDLLCNGYNSVLNAIFLDPASTIDTTNFADPLRDLSRTDATRSSSNWIVAPEPYWQIDNDSSRLMPSNSAPAQLTWHIPGISSFAGRISYRSTLVPHPLGALKLYASADGTTWTLLTLMEHATTPDSNDWVSQTISNAVGFPANTQYVRLEMTAPAADSLQLDRIAITHPVNQPPSIIQPAAADRTSSYGRPIHLSVQAADDAGENTLTYSWAATGSSPADVTFSDNGTHEAQNTTATFTVTGTYTLQVTVSDSHGQRTVSTVSVYYSATPMAPSGLTATTQSSSSILLRWTDLSDNETGFVIERATNRTFSNNLTSINVSAQSTSYQDTGLIGNATYYYRVRARNAGGNSAATTLASATTQPSTTVPGVSPSARFTTVPGRIVLNWDTPLGGPYTGYQIYRATSPTGTYVKLTTTGPATGNSYSDNTATAGVTYYYKVSALNTYGEGPLSAPQAQTCASAAVTYLTTDTTTLGNWKGHYGTQGYMIFGDATSLPAWAQITMTGIYNNYEWPSTTTNPGDLQKAQSNTEHLYAPLWSFTTFGVDIHLTDGQTHQIALYTQPGHPNGMVDLIHVVDVATGNLLDVQEVRGFDVTRGSYVVFNVSGHVRIDIRNDGYNNNLSAIFVDPQAHPTSTTFFDPLNDLSRTDSTRTTSSLGIDTVLGWVYEGDNGRAVSVSNAQQSLVWHVPGATAFSAKIFHQEAVNSSFPTMFQFYTSSDGTNWTLATWQSTNPGLIFDVLHYATFSNTQLPAGTAYLRLDFTASTSTDFEVGEISIEHTLATSPVIISAASASTSEAYNTPVDLSVLARDDQGEANLIYAWSVIGNPPGQASFTTNGNNAAKDTTVTFTQPGTYTLQVTVTNPQGLLAYSSIIINYHVAPLAPTRLFAHTVSQTQVNLYWTDNATDELGFILERATDPNFTQDLFITTVGANVTTYTDTGLTQNTTYYYRVKANNQAGDSAQTPVASATTLQLPSIVYNPVLGLSSNFTMEVNNSGTNDTHDKSASSSEANAVTHGSSKGSGLGTNQPIDQASNFCGYGLTGASAPANTPSSTNLNSGHSPDATHNIDSGRADNLAAPPHNINATGNSAGTASPANISTGVGSTGAAPATGQDVSQAINGQSTQAELRRILQDAQVDKVTASLQAAQASMLHQTEAVATHIAALSRPQKIVLGVTSTVTAAGSTLYIIWIARGGSLLASLLTAAPVWRFLDPLPVLDRAKAKGLTKVRKTKKLTTPPKESDDNDRDLDALVD